MCVQDSWKRWAKTEYFETLETVTVVITEMVFFYLVIFIGASFYLQSSSAGSIKHSFTALIRITGKEVRSQIPLFLISACNSAFFQLSTLVQGLVFSSSLIHVLASTLYFR